MPAERPRIMLPLPEHFDSSQVGAIWRVPYQERAAQAEAWARLHQIPHAGDDDHRVGLVLVDCQNTFCIPGFELFVAGRSGSGAVDDNVRLSEFIYRNLGSITEIVASLDTHTAMQVFHSVFFLNAAGEHPPPYTGIPLGDIENGRWQINPAVARSLGHELAYLRAHLLHYCKKLAASGKYELMVWPYHAMLGGVGHALVAAIEEAVFFHTIARQTQARFEVKGHNPLVENYSSLKPEVLEGVHGQPVAEANVRLRDQLLGYDAILIAGQAKSHCVAWTVDDLLAEIRRRAPGLERRVYLLEDCMSPVVVPGADFTDQCEAAFARYAAAGVHVVRSTVPMSEWLEKPG
ncbi:isochorismatase [Planctomycetaceae bacterium SCGC AG-212-F19]|nr:isochorismatase [Planctomycetaceae bacterium SCGC AG-212-F19]